MSIIVSATEEIVFRDISRYCLIDHTILVEVRRLMA